MPETIVATGRTEFGKFCDEFSRRVRGRYFGEKEIEQAIVFAKISQTQRVDGIFTLGLLIRLVP